MTADGGVTWTAQTLPGLDYGAEDLSGPSASDCWAVGYGSAQGNVGLIDSTTSAGVNWSQQVTPTNLVAVSSLDCPSISACYALGTETNGATAVLSGQPPS
jgi:hypothetical protein